jgi:hypothetical protein
MDELSSDKESFPPAFTSFEAERCRRDVPTGVREFPSYSN